jgi:hypothetical protein
MRNFQGVKDRLAGSEPPDLNEPIHAEDSPSSVH